MQRANVLCLSVFLLGLSPVQNPPPDREPRPELSKAARAANRKTEKAMQGAWRLVDMQLVPGNAVGMEDLTLEHVGFLLVSGHYFSLEFHMRLMNNEVGDAGRSFVTGLHRFDLDEEGAMETSSIIGARVDGSGDPTFEAPDSRRHYTIELEGEALTMTRDDGHRLLFERLLDDRSRYDFYGNQVLEKDDADDAPPKKKEEKNEDD